MKLMHSHTFSMGFVGDKQMQVYARIEFECGRGCIKQYISVHIMSVNSLSIIMIIEG